MEEAKDAALDQLGVDESDAEFEVLDEPKLGLFGRVRTEARVRARVRPTAPRAKDDRRDRRRRDQRRKSGDQESPTASVAVDTREPDEPEAAASTTSQPGRSGRRGGGRQRDSTSSRKQDEKAAPTAASTEGPEVEEDIAAQAEIAKAFVSGLVERFELAADVGVVEVDEDTVEIRVVGDNLGLLIGPKGQTLQAVQDLARTAVQRRVPTTTARILVDIGGYRERRRAALERFTEEQASLVVSSGEARALEPMSPADRKVVHDTVNRIDGVRTTSEGEEPRRRVVILPAS